MGVEFAQLTVVGTVGRDAELRKTPRGTSEASFSVASNRTNKKQDGTTEQDTTWYNVRIYGAFAEKMAQYITKGKLVLVVGQLAPRNYTDKDGNPRVSYDVRGDSIQLLSKNENGGGAAPAPRAAAAAPAADTFDFGEDDSPF